MDELSICLIVNNEAASLGSCLDSVRSLDAELVIVDTGSTDTTVQIGRDYGARVAVYDFSLIDFAAARNYAIERATGNWVMMIDADETLDAASLPVIQSLIANQTNAGYYFERQNYSNSGVTVDYAVRLFPNRPEYRYHGRVHETVKGPRLLRSATKLHHYFAKDVEGRRRKSHLYIRILKEELAANPTDYTRLDFLAAEYHQLGMYNEATKIAELLARLRPQDAQTQLFAGAYHLLYQPDFAKARAEFTQALRLQPNYPEAESFLRLLDAREQSA